MNVISQKLLAKMKTPNAGARAVREKAGVRWAQSHLFSA